MNHMQIKKMLRWAVWLAGVHAVLLGLVLVFQNPIKTVLGFNTEMHQLVWVFSDTIMWDLAADVLLIVLSHTIGNSWDREKKYTGTWAAAVSIVLFTGLIELLPLMASPIFGEIYSGSDDNLANIGSLNTVIYLLSMLKVMARFFLLTGAGYSAGRRAGGNLMGLILFAAFLWVLEAVCELYVMSVGNSLSAHGQSVFTRGTLYTVPDMCSWAVKSIIGAVMAFCVLARKRGKKTDTGHLGLICAGAAFFSCYAITALKLGSGGGTLFGDFIFVGKGSVMGRVLSSAMWGGSVGLNVMWLAVGMFFGREREHKIAEGKYRKNQMNKN